MKTKWIVIVSLLLVFLTIIFAVASLTDLIKDVESSIPTNNTGSAGNTGNSGGTGNTDNSGSTGGSGNAGGNGNNDNTGHKLVCPFCSYERPGVMGNCPGCGIEFTFVCPYCSYTASGDEITGVWTVCPGCDTSLVVGNTGDTGNSGDTGDTDNETVTNLLELGMPSFRYAMKEDGKEEYGIRFSAKISDFLKATVIDTGVGKLKWLIFPIDAIEGAGLLNETNIDWVTALADAAAQYVIIDNLENAFSNQQADGNYIAYGGLVGIKYQNINRKMFGIMYIEYNDGTRQYATFPEGHSVSTLSRSLGYVATEALNAEIVGSHDWSDQAVSCLTKCVCLSAGKNAGIENESDVPVTMKYYPRINTTNGYVQIVDCSLSVGNTANYDIITGITSNLSLDYGMPVVAYSTDEAVAVIENGVITAVGTGNCVIYYYCGTGSCSVNVTVT